MFESETLYRAKAMGIILMVVGHALYPDLFWRRFIYLFHMPLFYILSGYLFKDRYFEAPVTFLKRRVRSLYVPYIQFGILFICLHNVFVSYHLIDSENYTTSMFLGKLGKNLIFLETESLLGAMWFLRSLFLTSLLYFGATYILRRFFHRELLINICVLVAAFAMGALLHLLQVHLPYYLDREIFCVSFFATGRLVVLGKYRLPSFWWVAVVLFAVLVGLNNLTALRLHADDIGNPILTLVSACCGTYLLLIFSHKLKFGLLSYIGRHTMPILVWHLFLFKIVTFAIILVYGLPFGKLTAFPVIYDYPCWWLLYSVVGVGVPLMFIYILQHLKKS